VQAYGIVWKAIDKKTRETVALKKIFDAFQNATDAQVIVCHSPANDLCKKVPRMACCEAALNDGLLVQRTFREIMFLQELNNHENIIRSVPTPPRVRCLIPSPPRPIPL
jgi:mitogen-activated protein kinase 15